VASELVGFDSCQEALGVYSASEGLGALATVGSSVAGPAIYPIPSFGSVPPSSSVIWQGAVRLLLPAWYQEALTFLMGGWALDRIEVIPAMGPPQAVGIRSSGLGQISGNVDGCRV
jgi:hypothetical protein